MSEVSRILSQVEAGDAAAAEELFPLVYNELRRMAQVKMANERADHTLQPTALVHEAFIRLVKPTQSGVEAVVDIRTRSHFFAAAAEAMRRILIDAARHRRSDKRGGLWRRHELPEELTIANETDWDGLLSLDEALAKLQQEDSESYQLVMLRYFGGLTMPEAATTMGISLRTAQRYWAFARAWLQREIG